MNEYNDEARMTNDEGMTKSEIARRDEDSFWSDEGTVFVREEPDSTRVYDLEERTAQFGEAVIDFAKTIPQGPTTSRIITQLVGAGTSVGATLAFRSGVVIRALSFLRHSSFVLRHFYHA
jgi:hypothetical protein